MSSVEESIIVAHLESLTEGVHASLVYILRKGNVRESSQLYRFLIDKENLFWSSVGNKSEIMTVLEAWRSFVQRSTASRSVRNVRLSHALWLNFVRRLTLNPNLILVERADSSTDGIALMQLFCAVCKNTVYSRFDIPVHTRVDRYKRDETPEPVSDSESVEFSEKNPLYRPEMDAVTIRLPKRQ